MDERTGDISIDAIRRGQTRTVARALSRIENRDEEAAALADAVYPYTGAAWRIGLTGPPGSGKSSLANRLIEKYRRDGKTVAVIAVDPSSPVTGGALLGDRVRMSRHYEDEGVFIRSIASRGAAGGMTHRADAMADVLDAAGFEVILMETVGVGQTDVDIRHAVDTTVVVLAPGSGDSIQMMKAGLMEIADIFCINKGDLTGAKPLLRDLRSALDLTPDGDEPSAWKPRIVRTTALNEADTQVDDLHTALADHLKHLQSSSNWQTRRDERLRHRIRRIVTRAWQDSFWTAARKQQLEEALEAVSRGTDTPAAAAQRIVERVLS